jgi:hypothetical protein
MALERHLILQEVILRPSGEWTLPARSDEVGIFLRASAISERSHHRHGRSPIGAGRKNIAARAIAFAADNPVGQKFSRLVAQPQRELDLANASRDRQIYPVIGPGFEPGTSELTLVSQILYGNH